MTHCTPLPPLSVCVYCSHLYRTLCGLSLFISFKASVLVWFVSILLLFICVFFLHASLCMKALVCVAGGGAAACLSGLSTPAMSATLYSQPAWACTPPPLISRAPFTLLSISSSVSPRMSLYLVILTSLWTASEVQSPAGSSAEKLRLKNGENSQEDNYVIFQFLHNQMCLQLHCVNNGSTDAH